MNFRLDNLPHKLRTDVVLTDRDTHEQFSDKLRFIFIELPAFSKEEQECETDFERWIYVLKNMETLKRLPFKARKSVFEKLEKIVDIASLSKEERMKYDESIKVYRDNLVTLEFAEQKGRAEGKEEGRAEGKGRNCPKPEKDGSFTGNYLQSYRIEHRKNRSIIVFTVYLYRTGSVNIPYCKMKIKA